MSTTISVSEVNIDGCLYPPTVKPPGSKLTLFLAGAGVRGLEIEGKFIKFTANGLYLEESAIPWLAAKWKGKTADELMDSVEFFRELVTGPFEKLTRGQFILPLTGKQYAEKVTENCTAIIKELGTYGDAEAKAIEKFREIFRDESFPPGASVFYSQFPNGSLTISFSKDGTVPETGHAVIENKPLSEAVLESVIGKQGVSPAARKNIAERLSELLKDSSVPADSKVIQQTQGVLADSKVTQPTKTQGVAVITP